MTGRHFVVGDIHGCYDQLIDMLDLAQFDQSTDHLHALGDLVDRGPDSLKCLRLLNEPWFDSIMGNHEAMMCDAYKGHEHALYHLNGGAWFFHLDQTEKDECYFLARDLPVTREVVVGDKRYGLVHANCPDLWTTTPDEYTALWSRERVRNPTAPIAGIDHVYFGHTPLKEPKHAFNMSWIDTGCFATGVITIEELLP